MAQKEILPGREDGFENGLGSFCRSNAFDSWGHMGMWAYGASRVLDYLLTRKELDEGWQQMIAYRNRHRK